MPPSLCSACAWVRVTHGKLGQQYLLCRNDAVPVKYPPQPVRRCAGFAPGGPGDPAPADPAAPEPGSVGSAS